jgi:hypothetical protein
MHGSSFVPSLLFYCSRCSRMAAPSSSSSSATTVSMTLPLSALGHRLHHVRLAPCHAMRACHSYIAGSHRCPCSGRRRTHAWSRRCLLLRHRRCRPWVLFGSLVLCSAHAAPSAPQQRRHRSRRRVPVVAVRWHAVALVGYPCLESPCRSAAASVAVQPPL